MASMGIPVTVDLPRPRSVEATVGDVLPVPFPRPRERAAVLEHPEYDRCRKHVIDFLQFHAHQSRPSVIDGVLRDRVRDMPAAR